MILGGGGCERDRIKGTFGELTPKGWVEVRPAPFLGGGPLKDNSWDSEIFKLRGKLMMKGQVKVTNSPQLWRLLKYS